jgi:hypothetical protein
MKLWLKSLKGRNYSDDLGIDGKTILKYVLQKYGMSVWAGFIWSRIGAKVTNFLIF